VPQAGIKMMPPVRPQGSTSAIEATSYALLALIKQGDNVNASRAAKWLVSKRNSLGGYGSTQDTVMALQALTEYSKGLQADVNLTINVQTSAGTKQISVNSKNYDVLQIVEVPVNDILKISVSGQGQAIGQLVSRYNVPAVTQDQTPILKVDVNYDSTQVAVNDQVNVNVTLAFNPPKYVEAGMTVVDVSVPTGFEPVVDSIQAALKANAKIKRYDIAARKVIFYIDNLLPGDKINFTFKVKALYPVKAKGVTSQAYSYYTPEISATSLSPDMTIK
jgi:CD109 antigen